MSEGWNILVVDDEPPIRAELRYLLEKDARVYALRSIWKNGNYLQKNQR